jgi:hypothetical protein
MEYLTMAQNMTKYLLACTSQARDVKTKNWQIPSIAKLHLGIACRRELRETVFADAPSDLEFLPFTMECQPWYLINCLRTTSAFDESASRISRSISPERQIFITLRLVVTDTASALSDWIFTVDGSNRASLFCGDGFKQRVGRSGARGLQFREIGHFASKEGD